MSIVKVNLPYLDTDIELRDKELYIDVGEEMAIPEFKTVIDAINEKIVFFKNQPDLLNLEEDDWKSAKFILFSAEKVWSRKTFKTADHARAINFYDSRCGHISAVFSLISVFSR